MAQISRPFQIAFVAVALLAAVWLLAIRGHTATTSGSGSSVAPTATAPAQSSGPSAPGVDGLTRAVNKARGAVATSQQNAKALEQKSAQASSTAAPSSSTSVPAKSTTAPVSKAAAPSTPSSTKPVAPAVAPKKVAFSRQASVEAELKSGKVVVLLVWNPRGTEDAIVHKNVLSLAAMHRRYAHSGTAPKHSKGLHIELEQPIAVQLATPGQVASFGSLTRDVQIFSTPTLLAIGQKGKVITVTGAPGILAIEQATDEARHL